METEHRPKKKKRLLVATLVLAGVVLLGGGVGAGFWFARHNSSGSPTNSDAARKARVLKEVSAMYLVPTGEDPTVATIQDTKALSAQPFFKSAQVGDYVIIYKTARLGIIYREGEHKLINIAAVSFDKPTGGAQPTQN